MQSMKEEVTSLSKVVKQNRMSLDLLLASKGGLCTVINTSCCVYIDQTENTDRFERNQNEHWNLSQNRKNLGEDIFGWITSWLPNLNVIVGKLIDVIIVLTLMLCVWILFQICKIGWNKMRRSDKKHFFLKRSQKDGWLL